MWAPCRIFWAWLGQALDQNPVTSEGRPATWAHNESSGAIFHTRAAPVILHHGRVPRAAFHVQCDRSASYLTVTSVRIVVQTCGSRSESLCASLRVPCHMFWSQIRNRRFPAGSVPCHIFETNFESKISGRICTVSYILEQIRNRRIPVGSLTTFRAARPNQVSPSLITSIYQPSRLHIQSSPFLRCAGCPKMSSSQLDRISEVRQPTWASTSRTRLQIKIDRRDYLHSMLEAGLSDESSSADATPLSSMNSEDLRDEQQLVLPPGPWNLEDCSCSFDGPGPRSATRSPHLDPRVPLWPAGTQVFGPPGPRVLAPSFRMAFGPPGPTGLAHRGPRHDWGSPETDLLPSRPTLRPIFVHPGSEHPCEVGRGSVFAVECVVSSSRQP
jgi:hypothetical protein